MKNLKFYVKKYAKNHNKKTNQLGEIFATHLRHTGLECHIYKKLRKKKETEKKI